MNKWLITIAFVITFSLGVKAQVWPFQNASGTNIRGVITGTPGEYRNSNFPAVNNGARFHGGVDMTSPLSGMDGRAVFSMHAGTIDITLGEGNSDFWGDYVTITTSDGRRIYYKHMNTSPQNPVTGQAVVEWEDGDLIEVGDFLGLMHPGVNGGQQHLHLNDQDISANYSVIGSTNWINNFLDPFYDTNNPDFLTPFGSGGTTVTEANGNDAIEFWQFGHNYTLDLSLVSNTNRMMNEVSTIEGIVHKKVFHKVDIITRVRDRHVATNGGARIRNGGPWGNSGINSLSYQILDMNGSPIIGEPEISTISFNAVPSNHLAQYIFDPRSSTNPTRLVYIVTGSNIPNQPRPNRFWNSGLREGQIETWNPSVRSGLDARVNSEAKYSDGRYVIRVGAYDIDNQQNTAPTATYRDANIVVDNFLPFVSRVAMTGDVGLFYDVSTTIDEARSGNDYARLKRDADIGNGYVPTVNGNTEISITTSEPMKDVYFSIPSLGIDYQPAVRMQSDLNWSFTITSEVALHGIHPIEIYGFDYSDNELVMDPLDGLASIHQRPDLGADWQGNFSTGADKNYSVTLFDINQCLLPPFGGRSDGSGCPLFADFAISMDPTVPLKVNFQDLSAPNSEITFWAWQFGNGGVYNGTVPYSPSNVYTSEGTYNVTLTVTRGTETDVITKSILVSNDMTPVFTASPITGREPLEVSLNSSGSTGAITGYRWDISPSTGFYSFNNTMANPTVTFWAPGIYEITLNVTDGYTWVSSVPSNVDVKSSLEPIADFDWNGPVYAGSPVTFNNQSLYDCVFNTTFIWSFSDDAFPSSSTLPDEVVTFNTTGTKTVTLTVTDGCGGTNPVSKTVSVISGTAGVSASFTKSAHTIVVGQSITFTDTSTPHNDLSRWNWWFEIPEGLLGGWANTTPYTSPAITADKNMIQFTENGYSYDTYVASTTHQYNTPGIYEVWLEANKDQTGSIKGVLTKSTITVLPNTKIIPETNSFTTGTVDTDIAMDGNSLIESAGNYVKFYKKSQSDVWSYQSQLYVGNSLSVDIDANIAVSVSPGAYNTSFVVFENISGTWQKKTFTGYSNIAVGFNKLSDTNVKILENGDWVTYAEYETSTTGFSQGILRFYRENATGVRENYQNLEIGSSSFSMGLDLATSNNTVVVTFAGDVKIIEKVGQSWAEVGTIPSDWVTGGGGFEYVDMEYGSIVMSGKGSADRFNYAFATLAKRPLGGWSNVDNSQIQNYNLKYSSEYGSYNNWVASGNISISGDNFVVSAVYTTIGPTNVTSKTETYVFGIENTYNSLGSDKYTIDYGENNFSTQSHKNAIDGVYMAIKTYPYLKFYNLETYCRLNNGKVFMSNFSVGSGNSFNLTKGTIGMGIPPYTWIAESGSNVTIKANSIYMGKGVHIKAGANATFKAISCDDVD